MNKFMKKGLSLFLVGAMSMTMLAGCSSKNNTANNSSDNASNDAGASESVSTSVTAGTYTATEQGFGGEVTVNVTVAEDGTIEAITVDVPNETENLGGVAGPQVAESIVEHQSLAVDTVSGATVTSTAVIKAVTAALTEAGCDVEALSNVAVEKNGEDEEVTVDVVIAGAGGSGTAAALAAAEQGLSVLILEKNATYGGNSKIASGFFAVETDLQKEEGLDLTVDSAVQQLLEYNNYLSNGPLTRAIVSKSADTIAWLQSYGVEFYLPSTTTQFAHEDNLYKWKTYHKFVNQQEAFDNMYANLESMGAEVRYNTTFESLITDESGAVTGCVATKADGGTLTVNATATIVATGGFGANTELTSEVLMSDYYASLGMPNSGEGLAALEEIGAINWDATPLLHACQLAESTVTQSSSSDQYAGFSSSALTQLLMSPLLWVDASGSRFCNEDVVYDTAWWANAAYAVGGRYYIIVDEATLEDYTNGTDMLLSDAGPGASKDLDDMVALADAAVEAGTAWKASSIAELAEQTGMDAADLEATVTRYNTVVESGKDADYAKSADSLMYKVEEGNYYAFDVRAVYLGTVGGVKVDEKLQVIDIDYNAIPGLYAAGTNAGGYYEGAGYPPYEGLACGFAYTSGRIAGENAAEYVLGQK